jgi:uncharacterized protein YbbC (DUF1343 family)
MFRYRSQAIFVVVAIAALFCAPVRSGQLPDTSHTLTAIDVYELMNSEPFAGKHIGLITNQTGVDFEGRPTIEYFAGRESLKLVAIFSPEHGINGKADSAVADATLPGTGVPIYSLYGETRRPSDAMLKGVDTLFFDVQDAGVRFYTYVTTMAYCMEAAAKHHIPFVVFDRPDPLGGEVIEGPMLDPDRTSFTGYFPMPVRYGMTLGELAKMFNAENKIGADLHVVTMKNWRRAETYDQTGLTWITPSPNLRTLNAEFLYPGIEILQAGGISVGRGTDTPFEIIGAPWIHADEFSAAVSSRHIPGVSFAAVQFTPSDGLYRGEACQGMKITITDRGELQSMRMGLEIAGALHRMYPDKFQLDKIVELLGSQSTIDRLRRGDPPAEIVSGWSADLDKFRKMREKYLLYK